ncbi:hypothetical protein F3Y22_tig00110656pilonHSYRG00131 [Hibiscus syriacus]|uniref:Uncharacterized protein n=1 Tax=Hibiscus syriacus TaxID=106335 RepID=A0A6A2ZYU6_HIBSY|nr:hypothetical protein F3Y22_tig00110656pilonHSYRG00131 [Hibiscus syriacus]
MKGRILEYGVSALIKLVIPYGPNETLGLKELIKCNYQLQYWEFHSTLLAEYDMQRAAVVPFAREERDVGIGPEADFNMVNSHVSLCQRNVKACVMETACMRLLECEFANASGGLQVCNGVLDEDPATSTRSLEVAQYHQTNQTFPI